MSTDETPTPWHSNKSLKSEPWYVAPLSKVEADKERTVARHRRQRTNQRHARRAARRMEMNRR